MHQVRKHSNRFAKHYGVLERLLFGNRLRKFEQEVITQGPQLFGRVLIVGCGDGRIINALPISSDVQYTLIDKAPSMINKAIEKGESRSDCTFICVDFLSHEAPPYDFVLLPYFLNQFKDELLKKIMQRITQLSSPQTQVITVGFSTQRKAGIRHQLNALLITGLYAGNALYGGEFRTSTPDLKMHFQINQWNLISEVSGLKGLLTATSWCKSKQAG